MCCLQHCSYYRENRLWKKNSNVKLHAEKIDIDECWLFKTKIRESKVLLRYQVEIVNSIFFLIVFFGIEISITTVSVYNFVNKIPPMTINVLTNLCKGGVLYPVFSS